MKNLKFLKISESPRVKEILQNRSQLLFATGIVVFLAYSLHSELSSRPDSKVVNSHTNESPDTVIPKGYVLVPVELKNAESLSALIENFAIVDLYVAAESGKSRGQRVGHHLRLLRAPLNPNTFAVLVPDSEANSLVSGNGPLIAVIQNRDLLGHGGIEKNQKKSNHVQYYLGG